MWGSHVGFKTENAVVHVSAGVPAGHPAGLELGLRGWDQERIAVGDYEKISKAISSAV